jgi:hypothetical protein
VPHGVEIAVLSDGFSMFSQVFSSGEEALAWAEEKRLSREAQG